MALAPWADAETFDVLRDKINAIINVVNNIVSVPIGGIQAYYGSPADTAFWDSDGVGVADTPYEKFALCLGQFVGVDSALNDFTGAPMFITPNLKGRFPAGWDAGNPNFPTIGYDGGEEEITLTAAQSGLRDHQHLTYSDNGSTSFESGSSGVSVSSNTDSDSGTVKKVDGNPALSGAQPAVDAHNNLPPYLTTGFIIRFK
jgi:microcystin-dependent protein